MSALQPILGALGGCIGCQAGVELVQRRLSDNLNLLTFSTFIFVALEGLIFESKFFSVRNKIPLSAYIKLVLLFFFVNIANNYAMKFDIYFPLFIIFKSGSLMAHLILRSFIQKCSYSTPQIASVLTVTLGVIIFTLASYEPTHENGNSNYPAFANYLPIAPFWIGIFLLSTAILLSSYLGICQEQLYATYGKYHKEAMFYVVSISAIKASSQHFLSIPAFALLSSDLSTAIEKANSSEELRVSDISLWIPSAWAYIIGVCVLQWICVNNVYRLTAVTSSLNVNMIISLRKFISLMISFVIFGNPFNFFHILGFLIVVIGTIFYAKVF